jgi:hypothetical protein
VFDRLQVVFIEIQPNIKLQNGKADEARRIAIILQRHCGANPQAILTDGGSNERGEIGLSFEPAGT